MATPRPHATAAWQFCRLFAVFLVALGMMPLNADTAPRTAYLLKIDGAIGPATSAYISDGLEQAQQDGAELVVIAMDTPGGLDTSMREIIQNILAMPVPVVTYVHPSGARAASAGTYILYASHVAAMTPGTNLGAATPIQLGAPPPSSQDGDGTDGGDKPAQPASAGERKAVNDAVAYIRSLAELRGRDADWAESAVREAASLSAEAALRQGVIEIVAPDLASLMQQLDGRKLVVDGQERIMDTAGLALTEIEPDWIDRLLATITDPNIALILMMIGFYGLIFEFTNPGAIVPGTVGAISLLIALYALAALPVDFVGVALILLGLGLMVAEAFAPSFGMLGLGGLVSFLFGATIMFDTDIPAFRIAPSVLAAVGVFSAGLIFAIARLGVSSYRRHIETGTEELVGAVASVLDWEDGKGHVFVHSERWNAEGPRSLPKGASVTVTGIDGLKLSVSLIEEQDGE
jgi:membrane-bound serine protease (ClpP class)